MNEINNFVTQEELQYNQNYNFKSNSDSSPFNEINKEIFEKLVKLNKQLNELSKDIKNTNLSESNNELVKEIQLLAQNNSVLSFSFKRDCEISVNRGLTDLQMAPVNHIRQLNNEEERVTYLCKILSRTAKYTEDGQLLKDLHETILPAYGEIQTSQGKIHCFSKTL